MNCLPYTQSTATSLPRKEYSEGHYQTLLSVLQGRGAPQLEYNAINQTVRCQRAGEQPLFPFISGGRLELGEMRGRKGTAILHGRDPA